MLDMPIDADGPPDAALNGDIDAPLPNWWCGNVWCNGGATEDGDGVDIWYEIGGGGDA